MHLPSGFVHVEVHRGRGSDERRRMSNEELERIIKELRDTAQLDPKWYEM